MRDVIKDHIYEAGIVWAETLDLQSLESEILNLQSATAVYAVDGTSYAASTWTPIWSITSAPGCTLSGVDYYGGTFYFTGSMAAAQTVTFKYPLRIHDSGQYIQAANAKTLSAFDMLTARAKGTSKHYTPTALVLHDDDFPGLMYDEKLKFLDVSAYGGREAILNAEVGKLFGMKVLTTAISHFATGHVLYVDQPDMGYHVIKREMRGYREDKPEYDAIWYHMWAEENWGVVNDNAIVMSVNHGPTSGSLQAATANPSA